MSLPWALSPYIYLFISSGNIRCVISSVHNCYVVNVLPFMLILSLS
jgi:hypothetical protein